MLAHVCVGVQLATPHAMLQPPRTLPPRQLPVFLHSNRTRAGCVPWPAVFSDMSVHAGRDVDPVLGWHLTYMQSATRASTVDFHAVP